MKNLIANLKKAEHRRIYLSHEPYQEQEARQFAEKLRKHGFAVIVAADARPHKDMVHDVKDAEVVSQVIKSCDVVVVYKRKI